MKVAYVVKRYPRYSETFIVNEILAHEKAGLEIEIASLFATNDSHFQDTIAMVRAPVHFLTSGGLKAEHFWEQLRGLIGVTGDWNVLSHASDEDVLDVNRAVELAQLILTRGITHLHAHFATSSTTVARLASLMTGITYSFTAHAKDIFHESVSAGDLRRKLEQAAFSVTVSRFNLNHLRETFGSAADSVIHVYNGLDLERFNFTTSPEGRPLIVSIGRLVEKKGFDDLIRAAAELERRQVACDVLIIGTGEREEELRQLILASGARNVVLGGPRPQVEVIDLLRRATIFAGPYVVAEDGNRDGLPTVLVEAMAVGTPCIATDVTGVPEIVRNGVTGDIVPQRDPQKLADCIQRLLHDHERRDSYGKAGRAIVEQEFDLTENAARLRAAFERVDRPRSSGRST